VALFKGAPQNEARDLIGQDDSLLFVQRNQNGFSANANLRSLTRSFDLEIDAIGVAKPKSAFAKITNGETGAEFGVRSSKVFDFFEAVDFACRAQA
jgi:hypothetical protein